MENENEPTVACDNCGRDIPESKSFLHEAYCIRNIIKCPKCNEPVDKKEMDEHENEAHKIGGCKYCKKDMEKRLLEEHQEACPQKPKMCQFCDCEVSTEEYSQHIYRCGSRTKKCPFCNKNILVRDYDDHEPVCQINRETLGENFPSIQEEKKEAANPYSGLSSKYVQSKAPTSNPYESLSQASKPKKESSSSKHDVQAPSMSKKSSVPEEPKVSSKLDSRSTAVSSKTSSSQRPDSGSSYNYSKPREEKHSVPVTGSTGTSSRYTGIESKIPSVLDNQKPYSYPKEDPNAGYKPYTNPTQDIGAGSYKPGSYGVSGTGVGSRGTSEISSYNAAIPGGYANPTTQTTATSKTYLDNLASRAHPDTSSKGTSGYGAGISASTASRSKPADNKPEYGGYGYGAPTSSNKPQPQVTNPSSNAKYDPFSKAGLSSINKYSRPEDVHSTAATQSKVGATEKTYLRGDPLRANPAKVETKASVPDYGRVDDKKLSDYQKNPDVHSYGASRSNQPQYPSSITGHSSNLNKKYEVNKYEDPTKKASKLTDFSSKPSAHDPRAQASKPDPRAYEKKESLSSKTNVPSYSRPTDHTSTRTRDTGVSQSSKTKKNAPAYDAPHGYGNEVYEDEHGVNQDPELQRAIQESLGISGKRSTGQSRRNHGDDAMVNQSVDDPELQRAIQESLKYYQ